MNNDQSDCPKCYRKFHNKGSLALHLKTCIEDKPKISVDQVDPLALTEAAEVKPEQEDAVIEIPDTEDPVESYKHSKPTSPSTPPSRRVLATPVFSRAGRKVPRLSCYYCGLATPDRVSLTKHLVGQHWGLVRERQGGGRKDNSLYYSTIQDNRIIKPGLNKPPRNTAFGNLPTLNRKILPKPTVPTYNWTAMIKDQDFHNLKKKAITSSGTISPAATNSVSRYSTNSFLGKPPNRKILPKASSNVTARRPFFANSPGWSSGAKRDIPTYDLTGPTVVERQRQPAMRGVSSARARIPNTNHLSFNKVGPNSELHKLVKKFANSNSNLQITKVSK